MKPLFTILSLFALCGSYAQEVERVTYYDEAKTLIKERFTLKSAKSKVLDGPFYSYFESGAQKTTGFYYNNVANGLWEFYYENGKLRIRGNIDMGVNDGLWEYFYDNGQMSMEGHMTAGKRTGNWRTYFKTGALKSEGSYTNGEKDGKWLYYHGNGSLMAMSLLESGNGQYEEYYPAGGVKMKGMKTGEKKNGYWIYYYEDGTTKGEGVFLNDLKHGKWTYYNDEGIRISEGTYEKDLPSGLWVDYYENGSVNTRGEYKAGQKEGFWKLFYEDGTSKGEGKFENGSGPYVEYFKSGAVKTKGQLVNGKNDGHWEYFYEDGSLEGTCEFDQGVGEYTGYYSKGAIKMKGKIRDDERIGIWELYKEDGQLAGYYKPYYENGNTELWLAKDSEEQQNLQKSQPRKVGSYKYKKKKFNYFEPVINEYRALIIGYNPVAPLLGSFPLGFEFYHQERLGYELLFNLIRDPFFRNHSTLGVGSEYEKGIEVAARQKFYSKIRKLGTPYFGHEVRFSTIFHSEKTTDQIIPDNIVELTKNEQKLEYSIFVGNRFFKSQEEGGLTIDGYVGVGVGYRWYFQDYTEGDNTDNLFTDLPTSNISIPIRFGINLGYGIPLR